MREQDIIVTLQGVMLANHDSSERWQQRFDDIPRNVASAFKKYSEHAAVSDISYVDFPSLAHSLPPPREWLVKEWIPLGQVTALYGRGGVGKSLLIQELSIAVASGTRFVGLEAMQGNVLGLFCEDDTNEMLRRGQRIFSKHGINPSTTQNSLKIDARAGKSNLLASFGVDRKMVLESLWEHLLVECAKIQPKLIVLDNIGQMYGGLENERTQVTTFCNSLTKLAQEFNSAVVLLGHPAKGELSEYSGSTAWENAIRSRLLLKREDDTTLTLSKAKSNYSILEEIKLQYDNGVFAPFDASIETPLTIQQAKACIIRALEIYTSRQQKCSAAKTTANSIIRMMIDDGIHESLGRMVLQQALHQLIDSKIINPNAELPWRNASRHKVTGLALNELCAEDAPVPKIITPPSFPMTQ